MRIPVIAVVDALLVVLFATIGRSNHGESLTPAGIIETAWPFLLALAVGWAFAYVLSAIRGHEPGQAQTFSPGRIFPEGVIIWVSTVAVGMTARGLLTEDGVQVSFVIVATIVLGIFLLGWRAIARVVLARRQASARA
jgi:heme/copper-type cytochrome/quinol oxidase subunit 3